MVNKSCHQFKIKYIFMSIRLEILWRVLTSWHGNTKSLALWSLSPPVSGSNLKNVTVSRCEAIYGCCGGAATVRRAFHPKWLHSRSIRQDVFWREIAFKVLYKARKI